MQEHRLRISNYTFAQLFFCLIPVIPGYFRIAGLSFRMEFLLISFGALCFMSKGKLCWSRSMRPYMIVIVIWTLWLALIEMIYSDYYDALFRIVLWLFVVPMLASSINTRTRFLKLIDILIITGTIIGALAIVEELAAFNVFSLLNTAGADFEVFTRLGIIRVRSFTSHSITYGVYCMFILFLLFYRMELACYDRTRRSILRLAYGVVFVSSLLTLSRAPILIIISGQLLLFWFCGKKNTIKRVGKTLLVVLVSVVVISLVSTTFGNMISTAITLVLGMFNDNYADKLVAMGYAGDTSGVADRFVLYQWVWEDVKNHLITGFGPYAWLSHQYVNAGGYTVTKTSIEVQFLAQLYRYGVLGTVSEMLLYIMLIVSSLKNRKYKVSSWEGQVGFNNLSFVVFLSYLILLLAVTANECVYIFCVVFILLCAYRTNNGFCIEVK